MSDRKKYNLAVLGFLDVNFSVRVSLRPHDKPGGKTMKFGVKFS